MKYFIVLTVLVVAGGALAEDETSDAPQLGCVKVNVDAPEVSLDPWDSWQKWCELDETQAEVKCYDYIDENWVEHSVFQRVHVIQSRMPGERTCPALVDETGPTIPIRN